MADFKAKVAQARAAGYSDAQIAAYLGKDPAMATKIATARKAGYGDKDIVDHLGGSSADKTPSRDKGFAKKGYFQNIADSTGEAVDAVKQGFVDQGNALGELYRKPSLKTYGKAVVENAKATALRGLQLANVAFAPINAATIDPVGKFVSNRLEDAGIHQYKGEGVPELLGGKGFGYRQLSRDEAARETSNALGMAMGAPMRAAAGVRAGTIAARAARGAGEVERAAGAGSAVGRSSGASPPAPPPPPPPPRPSRAQRKAAKILKTDIKRSGNLNALQAARDDLTTAEAIGGATSRRLAAMGANTDLTIPSKLENLVTQRVAAVPDRARRISEEVLGINPREGMENVRQYAAARRAEAEPLYDDFRENTGPLDDPEWRDILSDRTINPFIARAAKMVEGPDRPAFHVIDELQLPEGLPSGARAGSPMGRRKAISADDAAASSQRDLEAVAIGDFEGVAPSQVQRHVPTAEVIDVAKRLMDDEMEMLLAAGRKTEAFYLQDKLKRYIAKVDNMTGGETGKYATAREAGGKAPKAEAVADRAQRLFSNATTNDEFAQQVNLMEGPERAALVNAEMARLETRLGKPEIGGMEGNQNLTLFTSPNYRQRLAILAGQDKADAFIDRIAQLEEARKSGLRLLPDQGSKTMPMSEAKRSLDEDAAGLLPAPDMVADPVAGGRRLINNVLQKAYGDKVLRRLTNPVLEELGRLYIQNPQETLAELQAIERALREASITVRLGRGAQRAAITSPNAVRQAGTANALGETFRSDTSRR